MLPRRSSRPLRVQGLTRCSPKAGASTSAPVVLFDSLIAFLPSLELAWLLPFGLTRTASDGLYLLFITLSRIAFAESLALP